MDRSVKGTGIIRRRIHHSCIFIEDERFASNKMLLVLGRIFFATMLIAFGIDHFLYAELWPC
jgi:hypothetical protein